MLELQARKAALAHGVLGHDAEGAVKSQRGRSARAAGAIGPSPPTARWDLQAERRAALGRHRPCGGLGRYSLQKIRSVKSSDSSALPVSASKLLIR